MGMLKSKLTLIAILAPYGCIVEKQIRVGDFELIFFQPCTNRSRGTEHAQCQSFN